MLIPWAIIAVESADGLKASKCKLGGTLSEIENGFIKPTDATNEQKSGYFFGLNGLLHFSEKLEKDVPRLFSLDSKHIENLENKNLGTLANELKTNLDNFFIFYRDTFVDSCTEEESIFTNTILNLRSDIEQLLKGEIGQAVHVSSEIEKALSSYRELQKGNASEYVSATQ